MYQSLPIHIKAGFTLVELSIVLVITGLVVGGVLVGQDLIKAAEVRAQISQIDKFNTAVNTFKVKYGYLPGDIPDPYATQFGFLTRGTSPGQGDGNGRITGNGGAGPPGGEWGWHESGENTVFWVDLSTAKLIEGGFSTANPIYNPGIDITGLQVNDYFPFSKLGNGIYVYVMTGYTSFASDVVNPYYGNYNFFVISSVSAISYASTAGHVNGGTGISVQKAYNIDKKIDDGFPLSGKVTTASAMASSFGSYWFSNWDVQIENNTTAPGGSPISASATTCYDNSNSAANKVLYSLSQNNGLGLNCSLFFQFQ